MTGIVISKQQNPTPCPPLVGEGSQDGSLFVILKSICYNKRRFEIYKEGKDFLIMKKRAAAFGILLLGSFFVHNYVFSANTDIVINEIGAYPTSTHEWIEVWNKGSEPIDLTGWKFWENNTNHGLSVSSTDVIVAPNEYAVIVQDASQFILDYPGFAGSIFDSSWSSLNESGEEIGLKDASGNFVEKFTYVAAPNFSLQRRNSNLNDYTSANWAEHASGNTVGAVNNFEVPTQTPITPPTPPAQQTNGGSASQIILESPAQNLTSIKINEFVSDPESGNEWVELYNTGLASLNLVNAVICDSRNTTSTCKKISGAIGPKSWFVVDLGTRSFLNNGGDSVILKDAAGIVADRIDYDDELTPDNGQSLARKVDGVDTDNDNDWVVTNKITAGQANVIDEQDQPNSETTNASVPTVSSASESSFPAEIEISELLPNPKGSDSGEFIEIKNNSTFQANLSGWFFKDKEKKYVFPDDTIIFPGSFLVFYKTLTKIALLNTAGKIELFNNKDKSAMDAVSYEKPVEGKSYGLVNGEWEWVNPTPGKENESAGLVLTENNTDKTSVVKSYKFVNSIKAARQAGKGTLARVKGVVIALPGVFGSQYFYLADGNAGIQIYQSKKDFPPLEIGDLAQVYGKISEANGIKRINIKSKDDVDILSIGNVVSSTELNVDEIDESLAGGLVQTQGEITEIKSNFMYLDNGSGEAVVYFKQGAKIDKAMFKEGENARVVGVLEQTKTGWQIWPRSQSDIESLGPSEDLLKKQAVISSNDKKDKYLTATAGGVATLILGFLLKLRGAFLKRGVLAVVGFIKKNQA